MRHGLLDGRLAAFARLRLEKRLWRKASICLKTRFLVSFHQTMLRIIFFYVFFVCFVFVICDISL